MAATAFVLGNYLFYWVSYVYVRDYFRPGPIREYLEGPAIHLELLFTGAFLGVLVVVLDRVVDRTRVRRLPVLGLVALKTLVFLLAVVALEGAVAILLPLVGFSWASLQAIFAELTPAYASTVLLVMVGLAFLISFAMQVRRLIGAGVFWPLLIGRYLRPRTEDQVFLFMDLEGSTELAESLGHARYSALLQTCFRDLTDVVLRNDARVYQYVGDEVVLHWPSSDPEAAHHAVRSFFQYADSLSARAGEYERHFGAVPVFRGSVAAGSVTVAEIGEVKRSLAFHGDPLNTAARILGLCKREHGQLFVEEEIWTAVAEDPDFVSAWKGEALLRGKGGPVPVRGMARAG